MYKIFYLGTKYKKQIRLSFLPVAICIIIFSKSQIWVGISEGFASVLILFYIGEILLYIKKKFQKYKRSRKLIN
jgi:hypothetical protein